MPFGHNISPRLYQDRREKQWSKFELFQQLYRGLLAVGMVPIMAPTWTKYPWDEFDVSRFFPQYTTHLGWIAAYFDFPDSQTFAAPDGNYRPIMCLAMGHHAVQSASYLTTMPGEFIILDIRARKAGAVVRGGLASGTDTMCHNKTNDSNIQNGGWGSTTDGNLNQMGWSSNAYVFRCWRSTPGGYLVKCTPQDSMYHTGAQPTALITVRNIEILLCKGGLHVQVGTGARKFEASNIINQSWLFFDERIPGMGRAPADDIDKVRTNPVKMFQWYNADPQSKGYYDRTFQQSSGAGYQPRCMSPGCCYTHPVGGTEYPQRWRMESVVYNAGSMWNMFRMYGLASKIIYDSPRVINGLARHLLSPLLCNPLFSDAEWAGTAYYAYRATNYAASNSYFGSWEDFYYCRYTCFSDPIAPYGISRDPESGKDWWFTWVGETTMAFQVEGLVTVNETWAPAHQVISTVDINFISGTPVISDGTPITVPTKQSPWTYAPGENRVYVTTTTQNAIELRLEADISSDPADYQYEVEFEARYQGAAGTGWDSDASSGGTAGRYYGTAVTVRDVSRMFSQADTPVLSLTDMLLIRCAGPNTALPEYDWATYRVPLVVNEATTRLNISFALYYVNGSGSKTFEFRNLKLRRKRLYVS